MKNKATSMEMIGEATVETGMIVVTEVEVAKARNISKDNTNQKITILINNTINQGHQDNQVSRKELLRLLNILLSRNHHPKYLMISKQ